MHTTHLKGEFSVKSLIKNAEKKKIIHFKQIETKRKKTFKDYWIEIIKALIATK